jgi:GAF domain-containing protein
LWATITFLANRGDIFISILVVLIVLTLLLAQMGADSYLGVALRSSGGEILGLMVVIHEAPIDELRQPVEILQIFAARAATELERMRAEKALQERLASEALVSHISSHFINLTPQEIDNAINNCLQQVGVYLEVDRCHLFLFSEDGAPLSNTHEWCAVGIEPQIGRLQQLPTADYSWFEKQDTRFGPLLIPRVRGQRA